jgi:thiosulfate/3-mercaptopyruvate sulfurtransferase
MSNTLPLLIEAEPLFQQLDNEQLLILDTSSAETYARHHLPAAIHITPSALQSGIKPAPGKLPGVAQLSELFSSAGLTPDKHVIVYDDEGGGWAGRLAWTLDVLGHSNYSYLNGGIHAWLAARLPTQAGASASQPSDYQATIHNAPVAALAEVLASLDDDSYAIWDARSKDEYLGNKVFAQRGGHIPGAVNIDWLELIDRQRQTRLVDLDALQLRLNQLGLSQDKTIITHCQTHHRSGLSYLAMKILGYPNIKGYDGSWSEWGNLEHTPVEL